MKQFVVCSKTVSRSTRAFSAMLHSGFAESKQPQSPHEEWIVELPDDSSYAAEVFLNIIHSRFQEVYDFGTRITDLTHILRPWVRDWLVTIDQQYTLCSIRDVHQRLWIAWELGDEQLFRYMTKVLLLESSPYHDDDDTWCSALPLRDKTIEEVPPLILSNVEHARLDLLSKIFCLIQDIVDGLISGNQTYCLKSPSDIDYNACVPSMLGNVIRSLKYEGLWPLPDPSQCHSSVTDIASRLKTLNMQGRDGIKHFCTGYKDTQAVIHDLLVSAFVPLDDIHINHLRAQGKKTGLDCRPIVLEPLLVVVPE
ncbi:hypothetical protein F4810DRAFT_717488 [Camillea tinctor]|nr:hypothetical protein F4810DRAFT_717488 [Camillea tinctor]